MATLCHKNRNFTAFMPEQRYQTETIKRPNRKRFLKIKNQGDRSFQVFWESLTIKKYYCSYYCMYFCLVFFLNFIRYSFNYLHKATYSENFFKSSYSDFYKLFKKFLHKHLQEFHLDFSNDHPRNASGISSAILYRCLQKRSSGTNNRFLYQISSKISFWNIFLRI